MTRPDGYYYMGKTYYNGIFGRITNRGGNMNGIGIEMMLNKGSNLSVTYHRTAKLISKLLVDNNLNLSRVRPHHFFSGKNCPETLRMNGLWNDFMDLVKTEYEFALLKYNITLEFICNSDCVDKTGLIIKMPEDKKIEYQVKVTYDDGITKEEEILSFVTVVE